MPQPYLSFLSWVSVIVITTAVLLSSSGVDGGASSSSSSGSSSRPSLHADPQRVLVTNQPNQVAAAGEDAISSSYSSHAAIYGGSRVGVNIVDLMWSYIGTGQQNRTVIDASLKAACSSGFTTVRFAVSAFWPVELNATYMQKKDWYADQFTLLVQTAESYGCKLVPSLVWNHFVFVDLLGEHLGDAMRNPQSEMRKEVTEYIRRIVRPHANSSAIQAWELGNELNLIANLDMNGRTTGCAPPLGTPSHRTRADNFSTADMVSYESWVAERVRAEIRQGRLGTHKDADGTGAVGAPTTSSFSLLETPLPPISHGHAIPRAQAYNLMRSYQHPTRNWTSDTKVQFKDILVLESECCDWVSFHFYPGSSKGRWGITDPNSTEPLGVAQSVVSQVRSVAGAGGVAANKTLYVGEFGNENPGPRAFSFAVLNALKEYTIPVATIWIWEFYQRSQTQMSPYSIHPGVEGDDEIIHGMEQLNNVPVTNE